MFCKKKMKEWIYTQWEKVCISLKRIFGYTDWYKKFNDNNDTCCAIALTLGIIPAMYSFYHITHPDIPSDPGVSVFFTIMGLYPMWFLITRVGSLIINFLFLLGGSTIISILCLINLMLYNKKSKLDDEKNLQNYTDKDFEDAWNYFK